MVSGEPKVKHVGRGQTMTARQQAQAQQYLQSRWPRRLPLRICEMCGHCSSTVMAWVGLWGPRQCCGHSAAKGPLKLKSSSCDVLHSAAPCMTHTHSLIPKTIHSSDSPHCWRARANLKERESGTVISATCTGLVPHSQRLHNIAHATASTLRMSTWHQHFHNAAHAAVPAARRVLPQ